MSLLKEANKLFRNGNYAEAYSLYKKARDVYGFNFLNYNIELCQTRIAGKRFLSEVNFKINKFSNKKVVDIIIPVYNALEDVKNCINSLYKYKTYDFNLIVIDDCSDKETENYLKTEAKSKNFKLLRNQENLRFTKTVNKGFKESNGDYVVLLNSDTIVTPRWIEKILACFESDEKIGIVGPLSNAASWQTVPVRDDKEFGGWLVNEIPKGYSVEEMGMLVETISKKLYPKVPSVNGFCYVIKREVLDKNGSLDEEYFPTGYGEEDDFSIRTIDAGYKIAVADDTYIFHAKSKSYTHEIRAVLSVKGRKALDAKHGKERLKELVNNWKSEPTLPKIAKHVESYMQIASKNKKVVYTAIFGNYDTIKEPDYINDDWDYVCFTNNKDLKSKTFKIKYVDTVFDNQTKNARMIKILSHIFLIGYDYSLWIDGSVKLRGTNINEIIDKDMKENYIALHKHVIRTCIYDEYEACIMHKKDNQDIMHKQIEMYKKDGMPKNFMLFETAEIMRNQNNSYTKQLNCLWWHELNTNSIRDQLSLPYVIWKNKFNFALLDGCQWLDKYFHMYKHSNRSINHNEAVAIIMVVENKDIDIDKKILGLINKTKYKKYKLIIANNSKDIKISKKLETLSEKYRNKIHILILRKEMTQVEAYNYILKKRKEKYLCVINENIEIINSDWLGFMIEEARSRKDIGIIGPTVLNEDYSFLASSVKIKYKNDKIVAITNNNKLGGTGFVQAVHECCVLLNKDIIQRMGYFSESYKDFKTATLDMALNLKTHNYKVLFVLNSEVICKDTKLAKNVVSNNISILNNKGI